MKKVLLGVLIVIGAGVIAAPYVNGYVMEKVVRSQLEKYNQVYGEQAFGMALEIIKYDRGFTTSEIEWKVQLPQLPPFDEFEAIVLKESAKHGILGVTSETSLDQNSWYADFVRDQLGGQDPLTISTHYAPTGTITSTVLLDPFEMKSDDDHLIVSPAEMVIKVDRDFKTFRTHATFEGLSVPDELTIKGISMLSDIQLISPAIMDGETTFTIKETLITADGEEAKVVNLQGRSSFDFDEASNKLSIGTGYSADQLVAGEKQIDDLRFTMGINHLDAEGFESLHKVYMSTMMDLMKTLPQAEENPEQVQAMMEQQMAMAGMQMMTEVEKLLKKDLQIEISDVHLTLPEGEIDGDFQIGLKKDMTLAGFIGLTQQPAELTNIFSFNSKCTLPNGLVDDQEKLLVPMLPGMQSGLFQQDGEKLVHNAEIKDNKLYLNGNEFPLNF